MAHLALAGALMAALAGAFVYGSSLRSRKRLSAVYGRLAALWGGRVMKGSFFAPPVLHYRFEGIPTELSSFYLRRSSFSSRFSAWLGLLGSGESGFRPPPHGSRPGNYTQLRFHLSHRVLESFVIKGDPEAPTSYRVESHRPELPEHLLERGWTQALSSIEDITGRGPAEVRFDGDTLTIRKGALLMAPANVEVFVEAGTRLLRELGAALDERGQTL